MNRYKKCVQLSESRMRQEKNTNESTIGQIASGSLLSLSQLEFRDFSFLNRILDGYSIRIESPAAMIELDCLVSGNKKSIYERTIIRWNFRCVGVDIHWCSCSLDQLLGSTAFPIHLSREKVSLMSTAQVSRFICLFHSSNPILDLSSDSHPASTMILVTDAQASVGAPCRLELPNLLRVTTIRARDDCSMRPGTWHQRLRVPCSGILALSSEWCF